MSWKERVAGDPHGSLERSAARRGLSADELQARRNQIARVLGDEGVDGHLSVNEFYLFSSDPGQLSQAHLDHLDNCNYCMTLNDALSPDAVKNRTQNTAESSQVWSSSDEVVHTASNASEEGRAYPRWQVAGIAAAIPILAIGVLFGSGTLQVKSDTDQLLDSHVSVLIPSANLPANIRANSPVSLLSSSSLSSTLISATCTPSIPTVSSLGANKVELSWEHVSAAEIPSYCNPGEDAVSGLTTANMASSLSIGQPVMIVTPPTKGGDL